MIERYEVVDIHGNPTGQLVEKSVAHQNRTLHRVAGMLLFTSNGEHIIQRRHPKNGLRYYDAAVGGHVEPGETPLQTALREAKEELLLDLDPKDLKLLGNNVLVHDHYPVLNFYADHACTFWVGSVPSGWIFEPTTEVPEVLILDDQALEDLVRVEHSLFTKGFLCALQAYDVERYGQLQLDQN